jgi:uncharacterized membrane protein YoaK (UPF0700 family)
VLTKPIPAWILGGGALLAASAGSINVVGFLSVQHQGISHVTGAVSILGLELAQTNWPGVAHTGAVVVSFFLGCVLSGLVIRHNTLRSGYPYGTALTLESALLCLATYFLSHGMVLGSYVAALACGLQNAMATTYSGAVIRTTHITGIVTDLGISLGQIARREPIDRRRMGLYLVLLISFFIGGVGGAVGFGFISYNILLVPAALTGIAGVSYFLFTKRKA